MKAPRRDPASTYRAAGFGLIELMLALALGLLLVLGAVQVVVRVRQAYRTAETYARLQESARYALDALEPELRMAGYWGLTNRADLIAQRAGPGDPLPVELTPALATIEACGPNWAIDVEHYVAGANGNGGAGFALACDPYQDAWQPDTDVLVVRRASETPPDALDAGRLYLQSSRLQGGLFVHAASACGNPRLAACLPVGTAPPTFETRVLESSAYYVSRESTGRRDLPSLRRKHLGPSGMLDEELVAGVDDLQVRFGIDTDGNFDAETYVDPASDPASYGGPIVAVTVWLRVRAEDAEMGDREGRVFQYADLDAAGEPAQAVPGDRFRRFVVSKTFALRNARR
jgi:type IV pilus assembly protein PilW